MPRASPLCLLTRVLFQVGYVLHELRCDAVPDSRKRFCKRNRRVDTYCPTVSVRGACRNPLHGIRGALEMCRAPDVTPAELAELLASMQTGVDMMVTITSDLLDLEKMRSGKFDVTRKDIFLHELIQDVAKGARPSCRGTLTATVHPGVPPLLRTDGGRLRQVLTNGLSNACKHATNITLDVTAESAAGGGTVTLRILDDGPGLRGVDVKRLFDDFSAAASAVGSRGAGSVRGSGLGLPICSRLTRLLGGTLVVLDRLDGVHGVEFLVTLPRDVPQVEAVEMTTGAPDIEHAVPRPHAHQHALEHPAHGTRVAPEPERADAARLHPPQPPALQHTPSDDPHRDARAAEPGAARPTLQLHSAHISRDASSSPTHPGAPRRRRIVVVDDAPLNRRIAERYVTSLGHDYVSLSDGDEVAEHCFASAPADLILMDIRMVRMDGDAACRQLRAGGYTGPIIAVCCAPQAGRRGRGCWRCLSALGCTGDGQCDIERRALVRRGGVQRDARKALHARGAARRHRAARDGGPAYDDGGGVMEGERGAAPRVHSFLFLLSACVRCTHCASSLLRV